MSFQSGGPGTRLQHALHALASSQALLDQHNADLSKLAEAGHCVRTAFVANRVLREQLAQHRRDVIWARDRIRFGLDEPDIQPTSLADLPGPSAVPLAAGAE